MDVGYFAMPLHPPGSSIAWLRLLTEVEETVKRFGSVL